MDNSPEEKKESAALTWAAIMAQAWPKIRDYVVKFLLLKFLPRIISGPWAWLAIPVANWIVDHVAKPLYDLTVRKVIVLIRKQKNNQAGRDVQNSKTEDDFDRTFDDLP